MEMVGVLLCITYYVGFLCFVTSDALGKLHGLQLIIRAIFWPIEAYFILKREIVNYFKDVKNVGKD